MPHPHTSQPKILAFAGSAKQSSINKRVLEIAAEGALGAGAQVTIIDLKDYPLPIYDGDIESGEGIPANARRLRAMLMEHSGFLIASPEYNGSVTPLLKNMLDWASRPVDGEDGLEPYRNKVAVLMSASPGSYGGMRGLMHLRAILNALEVIVLPQQLAIGRAHDILAGRDSGQSGKQIAAMASLGEVLASTLHRLSGQLPYDVPFERRHDVARLG